MQNLETLLKEMDEYPWESVPGYSNSKYEKRAAQRFKRYLDEKGLELHGSILDLACGPVSLGSIYDDVVGFDKDPRFIKKLRERGIPGIIGDIRELPFDPYSFDYVVTLFPPSSIYEDLDLGMEKLVEAALKIARKKVIIFSPPLTKHLPEKFEKYLERSEGIFAMYDATRYHTRAP